MKKRRILALIAALLYLSMCFVACKKDDEDPVDESTPAPTPEDPTPLMEQIFNPAWKPEGTLTPTAATALTLTGDIDDYDDNFVVFRDTNADGDTVHTVYSLASGKTVASFADTTSDYTDENTNTVYYTSNNNYITLLNNGVSFAVLTVYDKDTSNNNAYAYSNLFQTNVSFGDDITLSLKLYDATTEGAIATIADGEDNIEECVYNAYYNSYYSLDELLSSEKIFSEKLSLVTFDESLYLADEKADKLTLFSAPSLSTPANKSYDFETKDHYIYHDYNDGTVVFMDKSLKTEAVYAIPSESTLLGVNVLNNETVIVQYSTRLANEATSCDFIEEDYVAGIAKYDLATVIVAADKTVTEIDAKFVIGDTYTAYELSEQYGGNGAYLAEGVENLASVGYINENGYIATNLVDIDFVILDNDGTIVKSIKTLDNQNAIPKNLGNGIYQISVNTVAGYVNEYNYTLYDEFVLVNANGEEIYTSTNPINETYRYIAIKDVVYDTYTSKVAYDLDKNKAELSMMYNNSFIVCIEDDEVKSYYHVTADETKLIGVVGGANPTVSNVVTNSEFYGVKSLDTGYYTYYNENGVEITGIPSLDTYLYTRNSSDNGVVVFSNVFDEDAGDFVKTYYIVK